MTCELSQKFILGLLNKHNIIYNEEFRKNYKYSGGNASERTIEQFKILNNNLELPATEKKCVCGTNIVYNYYIKNIITDNILIIGSECINHFCDFKITNKLPCIDCHSFFTSRQLKFRKCKNCLIGCCKDCGKNSIGKDGKIWTRCYGCLTTYKNNRNIYI